MYTPLFPFWDTLILSAYAAFVGGAASWFIVGIGTNYTDRKKFVTISSTTTLIALAMFLFCQLPAVA